MRLTNDIPNQKGAVWSQLPNEFNEWQVRENRGSLEKVIFGVRVEGHGSFGTEGTALWYTKERATSGPVFGSKDRWTGLGIFLDSHDDDHKVTVILTFELEKQPSHLRHIERWLKTVL